MNILIVGGGVAAFEAAVAAAVSAGCKVTVCSKEAVLPYRRPALSRMVAEELSDTAFYFKNSAFYQEKNIEILLEKEAVSIDRTRRSVQFKDGTALPYDRLILATGGYMNGLRHPECHKPSHLYPRASPEWACASRHTTSAQEDR